MREMPPVVNVNVINLPAISAQDSDNSGDTGRLNAKGVNHLHGRFPSHPAPPPLSPWLHVPLSCSSLRPAVFSRPWHSLPLLRPAVRPELTPTRFPCLRAFPQCPLHLRQYDVSPVRTPAGTMLSRGCFVCSVSQESTDPGGSAGGAELRGGTGGLGHDALRAGECCCCCRCNGDSKRGLAPPGKAEA